MISEAETSIPALLKNLEIFIGEAYTGLQGMKYLVLSKGMKKPMPMPLSVMEPRKPCEAITTKKNASNRHQRLVNQGTDRNAMNTTMRLASRANVSECENPDVRTDRCT
jgi:hypothetical protein